MDTKKEAIIKKTLEVAYDHTKKKGTNSLYFTINNDYIEFMIKRDDFEAFIEREVRRAIDEYIETYLNFKSIILKTKGKAIIYVLFTISDSKVKLTYLYHDTYKERR